MTGTDSIQTKNTGDFTVGIVEGNTENNVNDFLAKWRLHVFLD